MLNGAAISWFSKSQTCVALSTAEAEYIALSLCTQETVWLRRLMKFLGHKQVGATTVYEDNQAAQLIATTDMDSKRSKHIDVRYHYTREKALSGEIKIVWCGTGSMIADMLTKSLDKTKIQGFWAAARGDIPKSKKRAGKHQQLTMVMVEIGGKMKWCRVTDNTQSRHGKRAKYSP